MKQTKTILVALMISIIASLCLAAADLPAATALSHDAGALLKTLDPFYKQHVEADGLLIVGSEKVSKYALDEVAYLSRKLLANRPDVLKYLVEKRSMYVTVLAHTEMQTDLPECRGMGAWWDYRARGLGGRPVSCGEENVLGFEGDHWRGENIFIHEFAHICQFAIGALDEGFTKRLNAVYEKARKSGRFRGYAMNNSGEFWAEGVQTWFNCNGTMRQKSAGGQSSFEVVGPAGEHVLHLTTRKHLQTHMPAYAALLDAAFRQNPWVYMPVSQRLDEPHLRGYKPAEAPVFVWPPEVIAEYYRAEAKRVTAAVSRAATKPEARMASWEHHKTLRDTSIFKDVEWTAVGPRIQGGRIESVWSVKKRKSTLYCGVGSGNLWKSVNNGTTWKPIFESESTFSIAVVTVSDKDPDLVWVGTGEPQMSRSAFPGTGVFKSTDAGDTWKNMGLNDTQHISRVIIDPENNDVVYVAALGHLYSYNKQRGVFKTTDGGKTWEKVLYISEKIGIVELVMDPSDNNTLYAVAWERDRKAWNNKVAGPGSALYKSTDAGKTWKRIGKGLPTGENAGRMGITIAASNPKVLYILCDHQGVGGEVYRSDDGGENWRKTHTGRVPTGVHFALCLIRVMPDNEDEIFIVAFNLLHSSDGGKTMTSITERTVPMLSYKADRPTPHCDNHDMFIDPDDPDRILLGTDGGLYISHDRGKIWLHVNTLPIAEFYAISVDAREPYKIWGGTQDNGMLGGEAKPMTLGQEHWYWDHRGDYYVTWVDPNNLDTLYTEGFHGSMERRNLKTGEESRIKPGPAPDGERLRFGWMAPFILSHYDSKTLYAGANYVFKSKNRGDKWTRISPDLTTNPGPERRGNFPFGTITSISESELKKGLLYAGTDDGQLHVTKDDGATWTKINKGLPDKWVSRVVASKYDEGTAFVSHTGYREDDFEAYLYMTTDFGETWKSIVNNMPSESINVIREDPTDKDILYVGTDLGAYCSINKGKTWHSLCKTLPTCAVHDLAVHAGTGDLVAGTHGRSAFVLHAKEIQKIKQEMGDESDLRKANTESIKAEAKTRGASGGLDCSKLKPTKIQKGEWSSPDHTLRSERFDIFWGDKRSAEPWKDFPTDSPKYFDPREVLKTAEDFWTKAVDEMQVYRGDHYVPRDRLRIVIKGTWTTWRGKPDGNGEGWYAIGGGITVEEDGKKSLPGGHIIITPKAARDPYVVTHELTHALQTFAAWDTDPPGPPVDAAAWKVFGMTHESHATFIPLLAGIGDGKTKLCVAALATKHLRPGRKRPYQNWTWMQFLCDKENPRFFCRVIQDHRSLGMHPFASVKRRKKFSAKQFADYWFEHAQRNVTGDYTTPNIRLTIERMRKDKNPLTVKMLPVAGKRDTFEVPTEFVPQRFAYNHILLRPEGRAEGESHEIRVTLQGKPNEDKSADWRFGFCVITSDDTQRYIGPASDGKCATVKLAADDKQVYLVVMATPDNLSPFDSDDPKEEDVPRYPYTVKIQGAVPG